ncbi:hypothetical protein [Celeribacter sp. SCSIO 80788]|jgi:hypothetical protein|uniref:hypothetical protein n=1 Tax=Celeribacter sp. SCSIO 80788 TaxID=3117013 RepID=UPI003DA5BF10
MVQNAPSPSLPIPKDVLSLFKWLASVTGATLSVLLAVASQSADNQGFFLLTLSGALLILLIFLIFLYLAFFTGLVAVSGQGSARDKKAWLRNRRFLAALRSHRAQPLPEAGPWKRLTSRRVLAHLWFRRVLPAFLLLMAIPMVIVPMLQLFLGADQISLDMKQAKHMIRLETCLRTLELRKEISALSESDPFDTDPTACASFR